MYIVVRDINSPFECTVLDEDAVFEGAKKKVFGPDTKEVCEEWKSENCSTSEESRKDE